MLGNSNGPYIVQVRTRGNFRLQRSICRFPNLRLNVQKKQVEGTVFGGQDKFKMVTYCRERDDYEQNVLEEYLAYRLYNLVTDASFRVRLARVTYLDSSGRNDPVTHYGFLIEDADAMAARLGGKLMEIEAAAPLDLDGDASVRMALFQYMIGNTDWSMVRFHNTELVQLPGPTYFPVPYDFDFSGLVNTPYASPDPRLGIRSVRDRVYRGFCRFDVDWKGAYAYFGEREGAFYDLVRQQPGLEEGNVERAIDYLEEFFETINSERRASALVERACRA